MTQVSQLLTLVTNWICLLPTCKYAKYIGIALVNDYMTYPCPPLSRLTVRQAVNKLVVIVVQGTSGIGSVGLRLEK